MKKYRLIYGSMVLLTLLLLFLFGNTYLFALAIMEIALVVVLYGLLRIETISMSSKLHVNQGCVVGEQCPMYFEFQGKTPFIATGVVRVVLEFRNALYGTSTVQELRIPSTHKKSRYEIDYHPQTCGEEHISCKEIVLYDVFGIVSMRLTPMTEKMVVVVPQSVPIQLLDQTVSSGNSEGEQNDYRKRGNDFSEVFDLREYQTGDDVRAIHWKLSSKIDKLVVKEAGYSTHYDTVVLFDVGLGNGEIRWEDPVLSGAMDFAITFSEKLLEIGRAHYVVSLMNHNLELKEVSSYNQLVQFVHQSMGVCLPERTGETLAHFLLESMQNHFSRILYITAGEFPEELYRLAQETEVTAVCITDKTEEVGTVEKGKSNLIEIPRDELYEHVHYFYV